MQAVRFAIALRKSQGHCVHVYRATLWSRSVVVVAMSENGDVQGFECQVADTPYNKPWDRDTNSKRVLSRVPSPFTRIRSDSVGPCKHCGSYFSFTGFTSLLL
jgi:hypothetical protein